MAGTPSAAITVLLFAGLREHAGRDRLELEAAGLGDIRSCWVRCCALVPGLAAAAGPEEALRPARNRELVGWDAAVGPGDELAFLPPVSGGSGAASSEPAPQPVMVHIGPEPIDAGRLAAALPTAGVGGRVTFVGIVRDPDEGRSVPHLDYEAYGPMAEAFCLRIALAACRELGVVAIGVQHRTGRVAAGDPSVAVAVAAAHRAEAFSACARVIDELKAQAPIWKRSGLPANG